MKKIRLTKTEGMEGGAALLLNLPNRQVILDTEGVELGDSDAELLLAEYVGVVEEVAIEPPLAAEETVAEPELPAAEETSASATPEEADRLGGSSGAVEGEV